MHLSKELRIGNWILKNRDGNYEPIQVDPPELLLITRAEAENVVDSNYRLIKISEDILLQCGFKKVIDDCYTLSIKGHTLAVYYNGKDGIYRFNNRFYLAPDAYKCYVNQLQNFAHILMGCELKLNMLVVSSQQ